VRGRLGAGSRVIQRNDRADVRIAPARTIDEMAAVSATPFQTRQRNAAEYRTIERWQRAGPVKRPLKIFEQEPSTLQVGVASNTAEDCPAVRVCAVCENADERLETVASDSGGRVSQNDKNLTRQKGVCNLSTMKKPAD
jgi:hypothetical protein